jgi:glycosyltransferase involved in cell wall biosynthesis
MKIGLISYGSLDTNSGDCRRNRMLSDCVYNQMLSERLQHEGDEVEHIVLPYQNYGLRLADNLAEELFERLRDTRFDLLLQDADCHASLFRLNKRLRRRVRYPIVSIVHHLVADDPGSMWQDRFYCAIERSYLETVDGFVCGSQALQSAVHNRLKNKRPTLVAYPAGDRPGKPITVEKITSRVQENGQLRIMFTDDLSPGKGLHTLIDALARIEPSDWRLIIAGSAAVDRVYARSIADRLRRYQMLDRVAHVDPLDGAKLSRHYKSSHVLAAPSTCEEFSVSHLQGMGCGLPLITMASAAAKEIVTHGVDSFLIPPGDTDALAGYLQTLSRDQEKLLAMSLAALARFDAHPTWSQSTGVIVEFLSQLSEARQLRKSKVVV